MTKWMHEKKNISALLLKWAEQKGAAFSVLARH